MSLVVLARFPISNVVKIECRELEGRVISIVNNDRCRLGSNLSPRGAGVSSDLEKRTSRCTRGPTVRAPNQRHAAPRQESQAARYDNNKSPRNMSPCHRASHVVLVLLWRTLVLTDGTRICGTAGSGRTCKQPLTTAMSRRLLGVFDQAIFLMREHANIGMRHRGQRKPRRGEGYRRLLVFARMVHSVLP